MGKYTILKDPRVDKYIDKYLEDVIQLIVENIPSSRISSIILAGSFGKGEGSVIIDDHGVKPLRDFDIKIIFKSKPPPAYFITDLRKKIEHKFGLSLDPEYPLIGNLIPEIGVTTLDRINMLPDIATYDLKKCKVIYGEDIRQKIKWKLKDIPLRTNARALFQKAIALIGVFKTKYLTEDIPYDLRESFLRETSRAYIEICVGLCLLEKKYHHSCIRRLEVIRKIYKEKFPELYKIIPDLVEKIEASTKYKLDPARNKLNVDPIEYWFETRKDLGEVIKYYLNRYLGLSFKNWKQFSICLERELTKEYYLPIIRAFLKNKNLPINPILIKIGNILFNVRENIEYTKTSLREGSFSFPLLTGIASPVIKIFSAIPLVLFAINQNGQINLEYINESLRKLRFIKLRKEGYENIWEEARSKLLKAVFSVNMI